MKEKHYVIGYRGNYAKFLDKGIGYESLPEMFQDLDNLLQKNFTKEEQFNLHYYIGQTKDIKERQYTGFPLIAWDIDHAMMQEEATYTRIMEEVANFPKEGTIVNSGNGFHYLIHLKKPMSLIEFEAFKPLYHAISKRIQARIDSIEDFSGTVDTAIFKQTGTLRLPNTINKKTGKEDKKAYFIRANWEPVAYDGTNLPSDLSVEEIRDVKELKVYPKPDPKGVLSCPFLQHCLENQADISEPLWFAMLTILGRLPSGEELAIEYSCKHPNYNESETMRKMQSALNSNGPRTCSWIRNLFNGCAECPHDVSSPICIKSEDYIKTLSTGFRDVKLQKYKDAEGATQTMLVRGKANINDLTAYFEQQFPFRTAKATEAVYTYQDKIWKEKAKSEILNFAEENINPSPQSFECTEFLKKIRRNNLCDIDWLNPEGLIHLNNGVLNLKTNSLLPQGPDMPFTYCLDYDYDPDAKCPRFDSFLEEVTLGRKDLQKILMEFAGYALSNMDYIHHKALLLHGTGSNGKSTLIELLGELVGPTNFKGYAFEEIAKDDNVRYDLMHALFNLTEELPKKALLDSSFFKNFLGGGSVTVKKLYSDKATVKLRTKLIISCNEMPITNDRTTGFYRRLLPIPFDAHFSDKDMDIHLRDKLIAERSGILLRVIEGYNRLIKQKGFTRSQVVNDKVEEYKVQNDSMLSWFNDHVVRTEEESDYIDTYTAYKSYIAYCEDSRFKPMHKGNFTKRLKTILNSEGEPCRIMNTRVHKFMKYKLEEGGDF